MVRWCGCEPFSFPLYLSIAYKCSNTNLEIIILKFKAIKTISHEIFIELLYVWPWVLQKGDETPRDTERRNSHIICGESEGYPHYIFSPHFNGECQNPYQHGQQGITCWVSNRDKCLMQIQPARVSAEGVCISLAFRAEKAAGVSRNAQTRKTGDHILSACAKYESNHLENACSCLGGYTRQPQVLI